MCRPLKITKETRNKLLIYFEKYIEETNIPIIAEFAYKNKIEKTYLYDNEEFSTLLKRCTSKKEAQLERGSLDGSINTTQAIFSLKQLGWRDKQEVEHSGKVNTDITVTIDGLKIED